MLLNKVMAFIILMLLNIQVVMIVKVGQDFACRASEMLNLFIKHRREGLMGR